MSIFNCVFKIKSASFIRAHTETLQKALEIISTEAFFFPHHQTSEKSKLPIKSPSTLPFRRGTMFCREAKPCEAATQTLERVFRRFLLQGRRPVRILSRPQRREKKEGQAKERRRERIEK